MNKFLTGIILTLCLAGLILPMANVAAQSCKGLSEDACIAKYECYWDSTKKECLEAPTDVIAVLTKVTNWLFAILLIIAVIFIIIAAFQFVTAGGSEEQVNKARTHLTYALIGIGLAVLAKGLVALVRTIVGA